MILRYDMKCSLWNKNMLIAMTTALICLLVGGLDPLFYHTQGTDFANTFIYARSSGTSSILALIYPILCCMPYSCRYAVEAKSGYINYIHLKKRKSIYKLSKILSCMVSGGISIGIPTFLFLLLCLSYKGGTPLNPQMAHSYCLHGTQLYLNAPFIYCLLYVLNTFVCGSVFALVGLAVSVYTKNTYLITFLPFAFFIFLAIVSTGINLHLNPILLFDVNSIAESKLSYCFIYLLVIFILSIIVFLRGEKDDE